MLAETVEDLIRIAAIKTASIWLENYFLLAKSLIYIFCFISLRLKV